MLTAIALIALSADPLPQAPPITEAIAILEKKMTQLEAKVAALELRCQCGAVAKTPVPAAPSVPTYTLQPSVKSGDAPTYIYPQGTTCTVDQFGNVQCSQQPVTMNYPGGPYGVPVQQEKQGGGFFGIFKGKKKCGKNGCG